MARSAHSPTASGRAISTDALFPKPAATLTLPDVRRRIVASGPLLAAMGLYALRSARQYSSPELWAEELAVLNLSVTEGTRAALAPMGGQFTPVTNAPIAFGSIWPLRLPWVLALSAIAVFCLTSLLFAIPPSRVFDNKGRNWIPLVLALVPVAPEMYGVGLYNFWWAGLWPVAVWTWDLDRPFWRRVALVVMVGASLTSLAASVAGPLFLCIGALTRSRRTAVLGAAAVPGFIVQALCARAGGRVSEGLSVPEFTVQTLHMIGKFVWARLQWNGPPSWPLVEPRQLTAATGVAMLFLFVRASSSATRSTGIALRGLMGFVIAFSALSAAARPGQPLNPLVAGPRYFFLPFAVLAVGLLALSLDVTGALVIRVSAAAALLLGSLALSVGFARPTPTQPVNLRDAIRACASDPAPLSLIRGQEDGFQPLWQFSFPTSWCRAQQSPESAQR